MQDDTPVYISEDEANGKRDLDSSIASDHSLANEIEKHKEIKRQEDAAKKLRA